MTLPKFEDWNAPWETEAGEVEIDKPKLKKYLHGLLGDKERLQGTVTTVTTERDNFKQQLDEKARKGETEAERLKRENEELKEKARKGETESVETLKLRVALRKGLTEVQAKRLVGTTEEELETDAEELVKSFGGEGKSGEGEGETPRRTPKRTTNPGDPEPDADKGASLDDALAQIPRL